MLQQHPRDEHFFEYLEGTLRGRDLQQFEQHLDACEECRVEVEDTAGLTQRLDLELAPAWRTLAAPDNISNRINEALTSLPVPPPKITRLRLFMATVAALVIAAAILVPILVITQPFEPANETFDVGSLAGEFGPDLWQLVSIPVVRTNQLTVTGATSPGAKVTINGNATKVDTDGTFEGRIDLKPGKNRVTVHAITDQGLEEVRELVIIYEP